MLKEIDLSLFPKERQESLEKIYRYSVFDVMFYRSNLWMHTHRVLWLLEEIAPMAEKYLKIDIEKARAFALVHDDAEIITGDIQAVVKVKMTEKEVEVSEKQEMAAIDQLAQIYPEKINGYNYKDLLIHAIKKDCIEAQLVSYLDKLDGYCESIHEVYAGNILLLRSVVFYANIMSLFQYKYPKLKDLICSKESPLFDLALQISPLEIKAERYTLLNRPHTKESLEVNTDFPFYKIWKKIVINKGKTDWLINQKEFLPN